MTGTFAGVEAALFDMDGVWFVGDSPVDGTVETLATIRDRNLPCRFLTNTTTKSLAQLRAKMQRLGLEVGDDEIINSPQATAIYLRGLGPVSVHCLVDDNVRELFDVFETSTTPDVVVIGDIGERWNYDVMQQAFSMLMGGADLVVMHKGRYWQVESGLRIDIGAFIAGLEYATGKQATIVGKPSKTCFDAALASLGVEARAAVMVGDDVTSDVGGAQAAGIRGVLVRTGKFRESEVAASGVSPDAIIDSIADFPALLSR